MAVPRLEKIVLNMGLGEATQNSKMLDPLIADLASIAGQKPVSTRAKKSIAAFKVREGMPIGAMVTLRGDTMYEFLDRLISVALPRVRDFRGVSTKSFDGRGNYTLGRSRSADLCRDRLLEGRQAEGNEHHDCDLGPGRQLGARSAQAVRHAFPHGCVNEKGTKRYMATTAKRVKDARKPKFKSRQHNRCQLCGRPRAFLRKFGVCRLCFRQLALKGEIPGVVKSALGRRAFPTLAA